jgi:hypothetical protein
MRGRWLASLFPAIFLAGALSGCAVFAAPPDEKVGRAIEAAISENRTAETSVVDMSVVFPEAWSELVIVCRGATQDELASALGFEWEPFVPLDDSKFDSMMVLTAGGAVVEKFLTGQDDAWVDVKAFTFCPLAGAGAHPHLIEVPRDRAVLHFRLSGTDEPDSGYWYIPDYGLRALAS